MVLIMATNLEKAEMLVARVLPQVTAQLESVTTFGVETSSMDIETIECAQNIIDRFLVHMKEIASAEKAEIAVGELITVVVGDAFKVSADGVWTWTFPVRIRTSGDHAAILLALGGLPEIISVLKRKNKRKAPDSDGDEDTVYDNR